MASETQPPAAPAHDCWASKAAALPGATQDKTGSEAAGGGAATSRGEIVAKIGTVISAIMASSCCWLPPLLLLVGVSSAGIVAALESYRPYFMVVTFGFLGTAFYFTYRPKRRAHAAAGGQAAADCCAAPPPGKRRRFNMMAMNKVMLWGVTAMAVVFLFFPGFVTGLLGGGGKVTDDMQCTVMQVNGMTCDGWRVKAEMAIKQAPGVLAVEVDYKTGTAKVGTEPGQSVHREEILAELKKIGYSGEFGEYSKPWDSLGSSAFH